MLGRRSTRWTVAAAVAGLGLVLSACSGTVAKQSSSATPSSAPAGQITPISKVATCPNGPKGTLNYVGDIGGPYAKNFNPFSASANTGAQQAFVYEPLLQYSLSQSSVVAPWLATAYKWSNGGKQLDFTLRQGVNWSDGQPFTSADVVFTFELLKNNPATNLKGIVFDSVKANGKYGVTMTFSSPQYTQLFYIGQQYIVPEHIWSKVSNPSTFLNTDPIGTGPYLLTELGTQSLILNANPHYWIKDAPCVKTVSAPPYVSNTTADLAMEQGNGDWGGLYVAGFSRYTSLPGHEYWNPPTNDVTLYPNLKKAPFNSLPLRQAISTALDRTKIEELGEQGEETPITNPTGLVLPRDKSQLASQYANTTYKQDVSKAKSILTSAGYKYSGGNLMSPSGQQVSFSILAPAAFSDWIGAVQEIIVELKAIGINAKLNAVANPEWTRDMQFGDYDMGINAGTLGPNSFYQYDNWLGSNYTAPIGKLATTNWERYSSSQADSLINSFLGTDDTATQNKAMAGLENIMVNDVPVIPLYYATDWGLYVTTRFTGWATPQDPYEIASGYDAPMNEVVLLHLKAKS